MYSKNEASFVIELVRNGARYRPILASSAVSSGSAVEVGDEAVVGDLEDRRLLVLVDGDDDLRVLHPGQMLDRARDADRTYPRLQ